MTVHNEILKRRPDLAPVMAAPWYMDRKGEVPEGKQPYFQIPIFNYFKVGTWSDSMLMHGITAYTLEHLPCAQHIHRAVPVSDQ